MLIRCKFDMAVKKIAIYSVGKRGACGVVRMHSSTDKKKDFTVEKILNHLQKVSSIRVLCVPIFAKYVTFITRVYYFLGGFSVSIDGFALIKSSLSKTENS